MEQAVIAGRYRLLASVGSGGMGRVWLARDEVLRRDVAAKEIVLPDWLTAGERDELRLRTLREARTAARLSHPNVVQIYDVLQSDTSPWIVMEYVRSRSLHQVIKEDGPVPPERAAQIGLAVLAALVAAHRVGVLHRDVKPHNVLIAENGRIVLSDFGLAQFVDSDSAVTRAGLILGSPQYVAPERARDGTSGRESDLWSLGATLYAAVEGRSPYARTTTMATLTALATASPDPAPRAGPLKPVLNGLLRKDPAARLHPADVDRMLRRIVTAEPRAFPRLLPRPRRSTQAAPPLAVTYRTAPAVAPRPAGAVGVVPRMRIAAPPARRTRRRRRPLAMAAAALVAVVAAGILGGDGRPGSGFDTGGGPLAGARPPLSAPGGAGQGGSGGVGASHPCLAGAPAPAPPSAGAPHGGQALPPGFAWHQDPAGFRIGAPGTWSHHRDGSWVCYREPGGGRVLGVDTAARGGGDPVEAARSDAAGYAARKPAGYRQVSLGRATYYAPAAYWEYVFDGPDGDRMHARRKLIQVPGRWYTLLWITRDFDWTVNSSVRDLIEVSFKPAAG